MIKNYKNFILIIFTLRLIIKILIDYILTYKFWIKYKLKVIKNPKKNKCDIYFLSYRGKDSEGEEVVRSYTPITLDSDIGYFELLVKARVLSKIKYF